MANLPKAPAPGVARPKAAAQPNLLDFGDFSAFDNQPKAAPAGTTTNPPSQGAAPANDVVDFFASAPPARPVAPVSQVPASNNVNSFTADFSQMSMATNKPAQTNSDPFGMFSAPGGGQSASTQVQTSDQKQNVANGNSQPPVSAAGTSANSVAPSTSTVTAPPTTAAAAPSGGSAIADIMALYKSGPAATSAPAAGQNNFDLSSLGAPQLAQSQTTSANNDLNGLFSAAPPPAQTSANSNPFAAAPAPVQAPAQNNSTSDPFAAFSSFSSAGNNSNPFGDFGATAQTTTSNDFNWS